MAIWVKKTRSRKNRPWTEDELVKLKSGEPVPTRTEAQCRCKANTLGISFRSPTSNRWTPDEVRQAKCGDVPPGRTENAMLSYCRQHRIPVPKKNAGPQFTPEEERLIMTDIIPEGHTLRECRKYARTQLDRGFSPALKKRQEARLARGMEVVSMRKSGKTYDEIGIAMGVSKQRAAQLYNLYSSKVGKTA